MKNFLFFFLMLTTFSCEVGNDRRFSDIPLKVFDEDELVELKSILAFFENQICENANSERGLPECYNTYFAKIDSTLAIGDVDFGISPAEQKEFLYKISYRFFDEIWVGGTTYPKREHIGEKSRGYRRTLTVLNISTSGKYFYFLKEMGKEYENIERYTKNILENGTMLPYYSDEDIKNFKSFNLIDKRVRLIIAIHYLTLNNKHDELKIFD